MSHHALAVVCGLLFLLHIVIGGIHKCVNDDVVFGDFESGNFHEKFNLCYFISFQAFLDLSGLCIELFYLLQIVLQEEIGL